MSRAKWCKGQQLIPQDAVTAVIMGRHIYLNGRVVPAQFVSWWKMKYFRLNTWHRAIPLVHEKELINRVLTYTKIK